MTSQNSLLGTEYAPEDFESEARGGGCHLSKLHIIIIAASAAFVVLLCLILGLVFGLKKSKADKDKVIFVPKYKTITQAPYYAEILGKVDPIKPVKEIKNEGYYPKYPVYGYTLSDVIGADEAKVDARNKIIAEATYLAASATASSAEQYTWMDEQGLLYQGTVNNPVKAKTRLVNGTIIDIQRQLYKHNASIGLYLGNVADSEGRIVKKIVISPRVQKSYSVTGLYAPAGEVIKVEISKKDMDSSTGFTVFIGQALFNGQANNIWAQKNQMQRFPILLTKFSINSNTAKLDSNTNIYTAYVGSFIGGPIYVRAAKNVDITLTISGGVTYPHFILGVTTPEMFAESMKSSAPYFDLEVWDRGCLHSGPRNYMKSFSYDDLYKAAILWDKVSSVTTYNNDQNIVFIYDPFVAAGAAVAFPGRSSVNCPSGWMTASLNYNSIVSVGTWGNFHEYHHNFQGYGVGEGGEVTNNGLNLVSYALFTKISSNRKMGNYGAQGLDWWTSYTSSVYALNEVLKIKYPNVDPYNGNKGLGLYACLLHNLGPDAYIKVKGAGGGQGYSIYMNNYQKITHNNMYYYFNELLGGTGITNNANEKYPTFFPIACIYQTGRSYLYYNEETDKNEKRYFKTMRPYVIPYGRTFDVDLSIYNLTDGQYVSGSIYLPTNPDKTQRFEYKVKSVSNPKNGKLKKINDLLYQYVPQENQANLSSGEIYVTLEIKDKKNQLKIDDIDLIIEFEMTHETLKTTLERTIYEYDESNMYVNATDAFENNYKGYKNVKKVDHSNPTQNCNTDIWFYPNNNATHTQHPNDPEHYFIHENRITELHGKLYFSDENKYRIYLRGRTNVAVYFSLDGNEYHLGAAIKELYTDSSKFKPTKNNTYFDVEFFDDGTVNVATYVEGYRREYSSKLKPDKNGDIRYWIYVKEVVIETSKGMVSYIGLGATEWTTAMFSISSTYLDKDGNEITDSTSPYIAVTWTNYSDYTGSIVALIKSYSDSRKDQYFKPNGKQLTEINEKEFSDLTQEQIIPPSSASYANAYRASYEFPDNKAFETDYFYKRTYGLTYSDDSNPIHYMTWDEGVSLVSTNFVSNPASYVIDNLFKEGYDNYIHPSPNTASGTYFAIDMGKEISANSITFHGRTDRNPGTSEQGIPNQFAVYISNDNKKYTKIGDFKNPSSNVDNENRSSTRISFGRSYSFRYINITIASSYSNTGRVILSAIRFTYTIDLGKYEKSNLIIINSDDVTVTGSWENKITYSTFGSVYLGKKGSKMKFSFSGTRLAVQTSTKFGSNYQVKIDGNIVDSIKVKELTKEYGITFLTPKLDNKNHNVEIECKGESNFDSFAYFID